MSDEKLDDGSFSRRQLVEGATSLFALASLSSLPMSSLAAGERTDNSSIIRRTDAVMAEITSAIKEALSHTTAKYPLGQASGVLHLIDNIWLGLAMNIHNSNPEFPTLFNYMNSHVKQGGDNADAFYSGFAVDSKHTYRLYGNRGTARYFSMTTVERNDETPWGGAMGAALYGQDLKVDKDGNFEVIVSAERHPGNWLKITDRDFRITIRQFFSDWENERPMSAVIERVGATGSPPYPTEEQIMNGLEETARWVGITVKFWQGAMDKFRKYPNEFRDWRELMGGVVNATPGGYVKNAFWSIPEDHALIMRVTPPKCIFWNFEFNNPWWETFDYRFRLSGTNNHYAVLEENGELIVVASHKDPGLPNWLDTGGHTQGMMGRRWMISEENPEVKTSLVRYDELLSHLPNNVKKITAKQRNEQLESRRRGLYRRFGTL